MAINKGFMNTHYLSNSEMRSLLVIVSRETDN